MLGGLNVFCKWMAVNLWGPEGRLCQAEKCPLPKDVHILVSEACECYLNGKRDFADETKLRVL